jgi:hypothetical protein
MLEIVTATAVIGLIVLAAVLSVNWACRAPEPPRTPFDHIHSHAAAQGLKIRELGLVPYPESLYLKIAMFASGSQVPYQAVVEDSEGRLCECYFLYGSWVVGAVVPRVATRWLRPRRGKNRLPTPLE